MEVPPRTAFTVTGSGFGVPPLGGGPVSSVWHSISVGGAQCRAVLWLDDSQLRCTDLPGLLPLGHLAVNVTVGGVRAASAAGVVLDAECFEGFYETVDGCVPCPEGGRCLGLGQDPFPAPGHFALSRTQVRAVFAADALSGPCGGARAS